VAAAENDYGKAREYRNRSLEILIATRGPEHPDVANALNNLGNIAIAEHDLEQARDYLQRALAIREQVQGAEHPDVAGTLVSLAEVAYEEHDYAASVAHHERALAMFERTVGLEHPNVAFSLIGLGKVLLADGKAYSAVVQLERALAIRSGDDADPNLLAEAQFWLARALWEADGDRQRARELAEAARATWAKDPAWSSNVGWVDEWLAER
jgi:tetratricopeptide (TPR) repeat protein